jgi:hypothetical protein
LDHRSRAEKDPECAKDLAHKPAGMVYARSEAAASALQVFVLAMKLVVKEGIEPSTPAL